MDKKVRARLWSKIADAIDEAQPTVTVTATEVQIKAHEGSWLKFCLTDGSAMGYCKAEDRDAFWLR